MYRYSVGLRAIDKVDLNMDATELYMLYIAKIEAKQPKLK